MDSTMECVTDWMTRQRWYASKGRVPTVRLIGAWELPTPEPDVRVRTLLVMDDGARPPVLYQVPITQRTGLLPGGGHHLIGRIDTGEFLYDGPHDPVYAAALLRMVTTGETAVPDGAHAVGEYSGAADAPDPTGVPAQVVSGEQSNTSIVYSPADAAPIICKVYRQLHHGENPDVVLQTALSGSGSRFVPASIGDVVGSWTDTGRTSGRATGHLAFAQEFLPDVEDAWKMALRAAAAGEDFSAEARELGSATAAVHLSLRGLFPLTPATPGHIAGVVLGWHQRLGVALDEVPFIAEYRSEIEAAYDAAQAGAWPELQRIHGDLHLGQVIRVPGRGWVLLDFEGEPMRPMIERSRLDLPARDVAGMLRSFDYVAGSIALGDPGQDRDALDAWATASRQAFLEGYVAGSGMDLTGYRELLEAFELDKAVYEAVYEMRTRPDWARIPLRGIEHLLATGPMTVT